MMATAQEVEGRVLLSAKELATMLGVNRSTIWSWFNSGRIPAPVRIGGTTRWRRREIEQWIENGCRPRAVENRGRPAREGER